MNIRTAFALFFICLSVVAQVPRTKIGKHEIGETLDRWYEIEPDADDTLSGSVRWNETLDEFLSLSTQPVNCQGVTSELCDQITRINETGEGDLGVKGMFTYYRFHKHRMRGYRPHASENWVVASNPRTRVGDRTYNWIFSNWSFSENKMSFSEDTRLQTVEVTGNVPFDAEVTLLTAVYGKPNSQEVHEMQNQYGTKWQTHAALWIMPDLTHIAVEESRRFSEQHQLGTLVFKANDGKTSAPFVRNPYAN